MLEASSDLTRKETAGSSSIVGPGRSKRTETVKKTLDARRGRLLERLHLRSRRAAQAKEKESAMDVLYENQRGLFLFGYPLYSSRSLLNFDPSPWTNAEFQDSPVDIRNAQVPNPTWVWSWKRWYVDMTDDVDEEGWMYSLSFAKKFSWHGTHPWFHSAVRRRRWLRQRVKTNATRHQAEIQAHEMAQDYFTIHSTRREESRGSSVERGGPGTAAGRSSMLSSGRWEMEGESSSEEEDITNVATLLKEMKKTTVDRKKLDAVKNFVEVGGDEVSFLPTEVKEVLGMFMYQNSRRRMLEILEDALHEAEEKADNRRNGREPPRSPGGEELPPAGPLRMEGLKKSIEAIHDNIKNIEYYSDVKAMEERYHEHETGHPNQTQSSPITDKGANKSLRDKGSSEQFFDAESKFSQEERGRRPSSSRSHAPGSSRPAPLDINEEVSRVEIKGIPTSAGVDVEPGIMRPLGFMREDEEKEEEIAGPA